MADKGLSALLYECKVLQNQVALVKYNTCAMHAAHAAADNRLFILAA